jgi:hypothetical protein
MHTKTILLFQQTFALGQDYKIPLQYLNPYESEYRSFKDIYSF